MLRPVCANIHKGGFAVIPAIIVIGMITIIIGSLVLMAGYQAISETSSLIKSYQAGGLIHACLEEGLVKLQQNPAYNGSDSIVLSTGTCAYNVTGGSGNRQINASSAIGSVTRRGKINFNNDGPDNVIRIIDWLDVAD